MANIEKGCNWYFPALAPGIDEQNITNSDEENLKNQSSVEALVRESIQNSLDVHNPDNNTPVIVEFKFGSIDNAQESIPNFLKIKDHIQGAKDYLLSRGNENANIFFDPMLDFLETHEKSFPYLCVSDSNTIGMDYAEEGRSRFFSFMNKGFNDKSGLGSGGSYGIGKAAYYMFSAIRSIMISSMYKDEAGKIKYVFKGSSKLTTHKIGEKKYYDKGHYDLTNATPVTEILDIPEAFLRDSLGTSIFIMGIDDCETALKKYYNEIIKSVVRNFWFAILDDKLVVKVNFEKVALGTEVIDSDKLKKIIPTYEEFDRRGDGFTNPRPYYEAVTTAVVFNPQAPDQPAVYFDNNHQELGHARFYLIKNDQKHDRYIKMRSPRMFVSMEKVSGRRGFNGVLVCDDKWNELLTYAEPPAHDNWDKKRIRENNKIDITTQKKAIQALELITSWVKSCIESYFNEEHGNDMDFIGTKDLLYTDKDFGLDSRHDGNAKSQDEGTPSDEEGDYGIATSKSLGIDGDNQIKVRPIASVTAVNKYNAQPQKDGKLLSSRNKKKKKKKKEEKQEKQPGNNFPVRQQGSGKLGKYREVFDVAVRCFIPSGQEDKHLYTMVITTNRPIQKAMIEVITGAAIGTIEVPIVYTDKGVIDNNTICDIPLEAGNNIIHFKFSDNISHKVTTATYEFK